jgi:uncharacterized membrane protein YkvA (DUF1232 family)
MFAQIRQWALQLKSDVVTVYFSARDSRCPWPVRLLALLVAAYALSPIDLIPDFIPVLGYLDDLLIVPIGLWLVIRLLQPEVLADARIKAAALLAKPRSHVAAACFILIWLALMVWLLRVFW